MKQERLEPVVKKAFLLKNFKLAPVGYGKNICREVEYVRKEEQG